MIDNIQPIFHLVHIPRSGGATLINSITNHISTPLITRGYQVERFCEDPEGKEIPYLDRTWEETEVAWISRQLPLDHPMFLYGHIQMGFNDYIQYPEYHYFTVIRHPIDRVWSRYNAYMNATQYSIYKLWEKRYNLDILKIMKAEEPELSNDAVRMISGTNRIHLDEDDLEKALYNIEHKFSYVIDYLYINDFFKDLSEYFPIFKNIPIKEGYNHIGFDKVGGIPSKEITEAIRNYNLLDMKLYSYIHNKKKVGRLISHG